MDLENIISQMEGNAQAIRALVENCSDQQAGWKPDDSSWSILEVINHLLDEEREDFRAHLDQALHAGEGAWSRIDPQGWVTARGYNQRALAPSLEAFLEEREKSLRWLQELEEVDWEQAYQSPFGSIRAGDILAAWVAHDLLHMRQLVELQWAYLVQEVAPYEVRYAGEW